MEFEERIYPTEFLPMGAIVTASGTGAEMNNGAVITNEDTSQKAGVLGAYANFAVLDPAYTMSLPEKQVISGAFDTLSHSMETYFASPRDITLSDEIAEAVMRNVIRNIRVLLKDMKNWEARSFPERKFLRFWRNVGNIVEKKEERLEVIYRDFGKTGLKVSAIGVGCE